MTTNPRQFSLRLLFSVITTCAAAFAVLALPNPAAEWLLGCQLIAGALILFWIAVAIAFLSKATGLNQTWPFDVVLMVVGISALGLLVSGIILVLLDLPFRGLA